MRFYQGAHEYLFGAAKLGHYEQCLYLVPEVDNNHDINAVMLHNGKNKLGSVSASEAPALRQLFKMLRNRDGFDSVLICKMQIFIPGPLRLFKEVGSFVVTSNEIVNERLARKFAAKTRKM